MSEGEERDKKKKVSEEKSTQQPPRTDTATGTIREKIGEGKGATPSER